jgi:hypothetical protein
MYLQIKCFSWVSFETRLYSSRPLGVSGAPFSPTTPATITNWFAAVGIAFHKGFPEVETNSVPKKL